MTSSDEPHDDDGRSSAGRGDLEAASDASPMLYTDLEAPEPIEPDPPPQARWLAFASIVVGGLLGGLIGYGTAEIMTGSSLWAAVGGLAGAVACAIGVGIVAGLTLRAMGEWNAVSHPESETRRASGLILKPDDDPDGADPDDPGGANTSPDPVDDEGTIA